MSEQSSLTAAALTAGFDKTPVVEDVSLELRPGQIIAIAGPNGVGKSTLLKTMARHLPAIKGAVHLDGKEIWQLAPRQFAARVAYVPQETDSSQDLTVEELVMLGRNPHQTWWQWQGSTQDRSAVDRALQDTEIEALRHKYLSHLSGGERQRAAIAVALAQEPAFMLLDEPTSHLDFRHQLELVALLRSLKQKGIGILIVLHDLNLIARLSDHVIVLNRGAKNVSAPAASGSPEAVFQPETLAKIFAVDVAVLTEPNTNEQVYYPYRGVPR